MLAPSASRRGGHGEKVRYLLVGACNTAIGYAFFVVFLLAGKDPLSQLAASPDLVLHALGTKYYLVLQWMAWALMVPVSTFTMGRYAFLRPGYGWRQVLRSYGVYLPAQGLSMLVLWGSVDLAGMPPWAGQLLTIAFTTVFSYIGHKYFTFRVPLELGEVPPRDMVE